MGGGASKLEEQFPEDICARTTQERQSSYPMGGQLFPCLRKIQFPTAKSYTRGKYGLPNQELPQQLGMMDGEATPMSITRVPTQGKPDPESQ